MAGNLNDFAVQLLVSGMGEAQIRKELVENQGYEPLVPGGSSRMLKPALVL